MKFQLIFYCSIVLAFIAIANAGTPSWELSWESSWGTTWETTWETSWGPSWSPSWFEHCQQACMLCGPIPFDPLCDCQQIFGVRCSPPFTSDSESSSTEATVEPITEGP